MKFKLLLCLCFASAPILSIKADDFSNPIDFNYAKSEKEYYCRTEFTRDYYFEANNERELYLIIQARVDSLKVLDYENPTGPLTYDFRIRENIGKYIECREIIKN